jgi:hypothetical protein
MNFPAIQHLVDAGFDRCDIASDRFRVWRGVPLFHEQMRNFIARREHPDHKQYQ